LVRAHRPEKRGFGQQFEEPDLTHTAFFKVYDLLHYKYIYIQYE
jgi:hypothetical protein